MVAVTATLNFRLEQFSNLLSTSYPDRDFLASFESTALSVQENFKIDFQDDGHL